MNDYAAVPGADIDWALQEVIGRVATAADKVGATDSAYTVSVIDVRNARLQIYRKSMTPDGFDLSTYRALAPAAVSVVFEAAALSATEIEHLSDLITALMPEFAAAGIRFSAWGPEYASGINVLYTATSPSSVAPEVPQRLREQLEIYEAGTVTFKVGSVVSLTDLGVPNPDTMRQHLARFG